MTDLEKVIKGLECCLDYYEPQCEKCPYQATEEEKKHVDWSCHRDDLQRDALELLKEQKPVVLCRDCKYWSAGTCLSDNVSRQIEDCGCYPDFATDSNWYCAEGKRRQDND